MSSPSISLPARVMVTSVSSLTVTVCASAVGASFTALMVTEKASVTVRPLDVPVTVMVTTPFLSST